MEISTHPRLDVVVPVAVTSVLLAPFAYALQTISTPRSGSIVTAGPAVTGAGMGPGLGAGGRAAGTGGGLLESAKVSSEMITLLTTNSSQYTWVAAAIGSNGAAGYQLASGLPVMAVGGFNGSDPSPTLEQFTTLVAEGKIHYFIGGSLGMPNGGSSESSAISAWVEATYSATTVGTATVFDLTK